MCCPRAAGLAGRRGGLRLGGEFVGFFGCFGFGGRWAAWLGLALEHASTNAFLRGLTVGCLLAGGVAAAGAVLAARFLPAQPASPMAAETETAEDAHELPARTQPATAH